MAVFGKKLKLTPTVPQPDKSARFLTLQGKNEHIFRINKKLNVIYTFYCSVTGDMKYYRCPSKIYDVVFMSLYEMVGVMMIMFFVVSLFAKAGNKNNSNVLHISASLPPSLIVPPHGMVS